MNDNIIKLREEMDNAWRSIKFWEMINVYGRTAEERIEIDSGSRAAHEKYIQAYKNYNEALTQEARSRRPKPDNVILFRRKNEQVD